MQLAVIEAARNMLNLKDANTTEFGETPYPVVGLLTEWQKGSVIERRDEFTEKGGTMRLGAYDCMLTEGSLARKIYGTSQISERHRHRYEVNQDYIPAFEKAGVHFCGMSPDGTLPEMIELKDHPWFIATQAHPELKSRPFEPHPLFTSFIQAAHNFASHVIKGVSEV